MGLGRLGGAGNGPETISGGRNQRKSRVLGLGRSAEQCEIQVFLVRKS